MGNTFNTEGIVGPPRRLCRQGHRVAFILAIADYLLQIYLGGCSFLTTRIPNPELHGGIAAMLQTLTTSMPLVQDSMGVYNASESFHKKRIRTTDFLQGWYVKKLWGRDAGLAAGGKVVLLLAAFVKNIALLNLFNRSNLFFDAFT
ncbi:hypothetical protein ACO0LO_05400 [Undibacterium sp. TJN25]|uniref:hypothetical protein n=1 Tax=Undibacterium sp. TJN25 TaxID=3413056 RepID=UPI003BF23E31